MKRSSYTFDFLVRFPANPFHIHFNQFDEPSPFWPPNKFQLIPYMCGCEKLSHIWFVTVRLTRFQHTGKSPSNPNSIPYPAAFPFFLLGSTTLPSLFIPWMGYIAKIPSRRHTSRDFMFKTLTCKASRNSNWNDIFCPSSFAFASCWLTRLSHSVSGFRSDLLCAKVHFVVIDVHAEDKKRQWPARKSDMPLILRQGRRTHHSGYQW